MFFFFFKQKTAYDMRISDWSSDVCSSDLLALAAACALAACSTTDAGRDYVEAARRIVADLEETERRASGEYQTPRGELSITMPIEFGVRHEIGRASCRERVCQYV